MINPMIHKRHHISATTLKELFDDLYGAGWIEDTDIARRTRLAEFVLTKVAGEAIPRFASDMIIQLRLMHGRNINQNARVLLYEAFVLPKRVESTYDET